MFLHSPQFLLLIPLLAVLGWVLPGLGLFRPLRAFLLLLLVLLLAEPRVRWKSGGLDLWVLLDRSASAEELVAPQVPEWRSILERSKPSENHRLHWVDFASEVSLFSGGGTAVFEGDRGHTRTALAVRDTLARMDPSRHHRLLLFTDGYSTEPLSEVGELLVQHGVALDYRLLRAGEKKDYRVARIAVPQRVQVGEPLVIEATVAGNAPASVPVRLKRNGTELTGTDLEVGARTAVWSVSDRITVPGAHLYRVEIQPEEDAVPGNNHAEVWVEAVGGPRVVLLTGYEQDPLERVLQAQGVEVVVVSPGDGLVPGLLTGAGALVINNVPAHEVPQDFLAAIPFFVKEQGGGFWMAGGRHSFGSGGYFESPVDELLPVSMELKSEHRKLAVAMAIVMDRSGSMGMIVPSGHSKMNLANEGAARAIELLGEQDAVTVFAVDTEAHRITPLLNVGASRPELLRRVRRIESMGGGINVYTGLKAAWEELKKADAGQRHVILFSDAGDSQEEGQYRELIAEMREAGTTVSVIGLGGRGDHYAPFLEDIARRGEGRIFFSDRPDDLPNIFAQETVAVARATFVDDVTATLSSGRWFELARRDLPWPAEVDGYNLSYLREGDQVALVSEDEYVAPLVAFGRRGLGRTAAVAIPLGGEYSEKMRSWEQMGDFVQTLTRWLMGDEVPAGVGLRHRLVGTEWKLDLLYDLEEWGERFAVAPPRLVVQRGFGSDRAENLTWERLMPGQYSIRTQLQENEPVRGAVQLGSSVIPFGPVVVGSETEWEMDATKIEELRQTARVSGGTEIVDLTQGWRKSEDPGWESLENVLLWLILAVFLLEAFVTRAGWRMPEVQWQGLGGLLSLARRKKRAAAPSSVAAEPSPVERVVDVPAETGAVVSQEEEDAGARKRRFSRAKKRL